MKQYEVYLNKELTYSQSFSLENQLLETDIKGEVKPVKITGWFSSLTKDGNQFKEEYVNGVKSGSYEQYYNDGELRAEKNLSKNFVIN